jgi:Membrane bound O-acyl transferase family
VLFTLLVAFGPPWVLACLRRRPRLLVLATAILLLIPLFIPLPYVGLRGLAWITTGVAVVKALQARAGHESPQAYLDFVQFLLLPVVIRWESPRRPDLGRALRSVTRGLLQLTAAAALALAFDRADVSSATATVSAIQIGFYLTCAGVANLLTAHLGLLGLDYDPPFRSPFSSRTPAEFWGRRWNTWVSHVLHRYVFVPAGSRRRPMRATLAAFAVSGLYHEALVSLASGQVNGWMTAYFLLQGAGVIVTSRTRSFRHRARRAPAASWLLTVVFMLATGAIFVRGTRALLESPEITTLGRGIGGLASRTRPGLAT